MSGPGGGTFDGPSEDSGRKCDELRFETAIASPNPNVIENLSLGDVLEIEIREGAIALVHRTGIAGSIVQNVPELIRCLQQGYEFEGEIKSIRGGRVDIEVRPA